MIGGPGYAVFTWIFGRYAVIRRAGIPTLNRVTLDHDRIPTRCLQPDGAEVPPIDCSRTVCPFQR